ncbi:hypothetical protein COV20_03460 [Candidatus Woesearchaeota archaeon CG10_big_fil_rev_8_21_14_0_10_45_16]|nr:MAG: hypothetical protein COV20_03460 [Candidatus Woesearchaeota archaeon CG10_big_fil_rev_8_21_14_0_10_45_16]
MVEQPAPEVEEPIVMEESAVSEPVIEEPQPVVQQSFKVFNPRLTYPGAYNGPLYGTSEQVGSASMDSYFQLLDRNGINFFIGMFGIEGEPQPGSLVSDKGLGEVIAAAQKHPHRIIPFFNPGIGGEEIQEKRYLQTELLGWYKKTLTASKRIVGDDFIKGFGEVETQEWSARHNDPRILELIDLAKANNIDFMFHPVASKIDDVERIVEAYPQTTFLIHMYREDLAKSMPRLITILNEHDNLYFSMDAAHIIHIDGDVIYEFDSANKDASVQKFVNYYDSKESLLVSNAIKAYKPLVDAAPDKVMWGTEIGPEYAFEPEVFDRAVKISRLVIAGFDKEDQEAVAYKNALRVFGEGVVADSGIKVLDTGSWPECSDSQQSDCDSFCETPDTDVLTPEQEACFEGCINEKRCKEVVEMDVG